MCQHQPSCPSAQAPDHAAARVVTSHPEQGWSLLCNGVVLFADTGELLPNGHAVAPHRPTAGRPRSSVPVTRLRRAAPTPRVVQQAARAASAA
jgi:hypothetical protein